MTTHVLAPKPVGGPVAAFLADLHARQPRLVRYGLALWLLAVLTAIASGIDERTVRDANVWIKPTKFLVSVGLFALTTAWFVGLLPPALRRGRAVRWIATTIVAAGTFEVGYIALQAALGQGSHYNVGDPLHATLYTLMGLGAFALTASQVALAVVLHRHGTMARGTAWRDGVVAGLALTFVLGTVVGFALGGRQPPSGAGLPFVGWHAFGDLRPAHFVGLHAHQLLPLAAFALQAIAPRRARVAFAATALGYVALWAGLFALGLARPV